MPRPGADGAADLRLACADGRGIPVEVVPATLPGKFGALCVLELRAADGGLDGEPELQKLAWSVEQSSDAVVISDADGVIHYVNPAFEAMTGFARTEVLGRTPRIVKSGHHSADFYRSMWGALRSGVEFRGVLINRKKSGELFHEEKVIRPFFGSGRSRHALRLDRARRDRPHQGDGRASPAPPPTTV